MKKGDFSGLKWLVLMVVVIVIVLAIWGKVSKQTFSDLSKCQYTCVEESTCPEKNRVSFGSDQCKKNNPSEDKKKKSSYVCCSGK